MNQQPFELRRQSFSNQGPIAFNQLRNIEQLSKRIRKARTDNAALDFDGALNQVVQDRLEDSKTLLYLKLEEQTGSKDNVRDLKNLHTHRIQATDRVREIDHQMAQLNNQIAQNPIQANNLQIINMAQILQQNRAFYTNRKNDVRNSMNYIIIQGIQENRLPTADEVATPAQVSRLLKPFLQTRNQDSEDEE